MLHPGFFDGIETYAYTLHEGRGTLVWNVTAAKAIQAAGVDLILVEVERTQLGHIATTYEIIEAKVLAADIGQPGIAAPFMWRGSAAFAPYGIVYILVDGIHRAVRAYRERKPFYAHILTDAQSRRCVLSAPTGVIP